MAVDKAMPSARKRKRGGRAETVDSQKRVKGFGNGPSKVNVRKPRSDPKSGRPKTKNKLVPNNGTNGDISTIIQDERPSDIKNEDLSDVEDDRDPDDQPPAAQTPPSPNSTWNISDPIGGRILDLDPVFTKDEKFILIARRAVIQVYSTSDSLLNRSIKFPSNISQNSVANIVAYGLSPTEPNIVWIACSDGLLYKVDWTSGEGSSRPLRATNGSLTHMVVTAVASGRSRDVLFTIGQLDGSWVITAHEHRDPKIRSRVIYTSTEVIQILTVNGDGTTVVAASGRRVLLGTIQNINFRRIHDVGYDFRIFESPNDISCLDVRVSKRKTPIDPNKLMVGGFEGEVVDLVVGDVEGALFVHNDLLGNLVRSQGPLVDAQHLISLTPRRLHWHRECVLAAKWSLDGNYIISGGSETVLVLWQIDTGKNQYLPHLSASIKNIVVSPKGASYAVHLSDNSTMVLSTADLVPTTNISSVQAHVLRTSMVPNVTAAPVKDTIHERPAFPRTQAIINPANPRWLLLAVGGEQELDEKSLASGSAPFLQTFDIASNRNVSRQAMTRNNVTNKNIGPNVDRISEPVISHMQISHDGAWLATVDEWLPPRGDVEFLGQGGMNLRTEQRHRREVYLKFWQWNKTDGTWGLVSRINAPHSMAAENHGAGRVFALITDPTSLSFSTLGEDGIIQVWRPRIRTRDGVIVRSSDGEALYNWTCHLRVPLGTEEFEDDTALAQIPTHGCLACSGDGSVLAAALTGRDDGLVHFIDPFTGTVRNSCPRLYKGDLTGMNFLGQNLITVSNELQVYDVVLDEYKYGITLSDAQCQLTLHEKVEMVHLAIDRKSGTFAISLPCLAESNRRGDMTPLLQAYSEVAVFDPSDPVPLYVNRLSSLVTAVVPAISSAGFLILDANAEITTMSPKSSQTLTSQAKATVDLRLDIVEAVEPDEPMVDLMKVVQDIDAEGEEEIEKVENGLIIRHEAVDDDDGPEVISQHKLTEVLDIGPSFALPPVEEMFYRVMELFGDKPRPIGGV